MPEKSEDKKPTTGLETLLRYLPWILIVVQALVSYGGDKSGEEALRSQVSSDHAIIQAMGEKQSTFAEKLAHDQSDIENLRRDLDQDRAYRGGKQ